MVRRAEPIGRADEQGARPRARSRPRHAFQEFLTIPLAVAGVFIVLAVVAAVLDRQEVGVGLVLAAVVPPPATSSFLTTVTPGLLTVVSIIFFVLLMAVQHQSSTYSPVVLDQFLRRKLNQVFFGTFVGLTVYCLLVLALVPSGSALVSGTVALLLSVVTFVALLAFVYITIDQIRPSATVWMLQKLALNARRVEQPMLARCRAQPRQRGTEPRTTATAGQVGYIVGIDINTLAGAFAGVHSDVEVELEAVMGDHVVPGSVLAEVRGGDSADHGRLIDAVLDAMTLSRMRDIDRDATQGVDQLGNMAWSATASAGDPEGARVAVEALHGLLVQFQAQDNRSHSPNAPDTPLPVVYSDRAVLKILNALTSVIVASGQSGQHQTCGKVLTVISQVLPQLARDNQQLATDLVQRVLPTARQHVYTDEMEEAFNDIQQAVQHTELPIAAQRVTEIKEQLRDGQQLATPSQNVDDGQATQEAARGH